MSDLSEVLDDVSASESRLLEFFNKDSIERIRRWSFEYSSRVADKLKIGLEEDKRKFLNAYILHETLKEYEQMYNDALAKFLNGKKDGKIRDLGFAEAYLPKYSNMNKLVEDFIKKYGK